MVKLKNFMKVERWSVVSRTEYGFQPPDSESNCLQGFVTGHPSHADGKAITTSRLVGRNADRVVTRSGSEYELGEPDPAYESQYPNAKERLLEGLKPCADQPKLPAGQVQTLTMSNKI